MNERAAHTLVSRLHWCRFVPGGRGHSSSAVETAPERAGTRLKLRRSTHCTAAGCDATCAARGSAFRKGANALHGVVAF